VATRMSLTAIYEPVENGWVQARIEELPAVITAGPTAEAARELVLDALREYLLSLADQRGRAEAQGLGEREPIGIVLGA
jgi:predicted RNase H-like HicB family nuclease